MTLRGKEACQECDVHKRCIDGKKLHWNAKDGRVEGECYCVCHAVYTITRGKP